MQVFVNSYVNYEGQALEFMRKLLAPQRLPTMTLGWMLKRAREIYVDPRHKTATVR